MKNRVKNAIKEYDRRFGLGSGNRSGEGEFFTHDFRNIFELSGNDLYETASNALKAGFIIGLRKGERDSRKRGL